MGLERIASVIQGKNDNYEIDLFKNITDKIEKML
jgi:alanyl-tRNA synthetase